MIPREILKKIRQIELRTNRIVTGSAVRGCEADDLEGFCLGTRQIAIKQRVVNMERRITSRRNAFQKRRKGQKIGGRPEKVGAMIGQTGAAIPETGASGFKSGAETLKNGELGFESGAVIVKVGATLDRNVMAGIPNREIRQIREDGESASSFYFCSRGSRGLRLKIAFP